MQWKTSRNSSLNVNFKASYDIRLIELQGYLSPECQFKVPRKVRYIKIPWQLQKFNYGLTYFREKDIDNIFTSLINHIFWGLFLFLYKILNTFIYFTKFWGVKKFWKKVLPWGSWINWRKVQPERMEDMVIC